MNYMRPAGFGIDEALFERYTVHGCGTRVTQSSAPELVGALIEAADLAPGQRVLEVGTGSGYSAAVLAQIVGSSGRVLSLDVNQTLVQQARALLRADGLGQVEVHCQDARAGLPERGPFDRVIAWATSPTSGGTWLAAVREGGLLVMPVAIAAARRNGCGAGAAGGRLAACRAVDERRLRPPPRADRSVRARPGRRGGRGLDRR